MNKEEQKKNNKRNYKDNKRSENVNIKRQFNKENKKINKTFKEFKKEIKTQKINCYKTVVTVCGENLYLLMVTAVNQDFQKGLYLRIVWECKKKDQKNGD